MTNLHRTLAVLLLCGLIAAAEPDKKPLPLEARKREYASLQKELEASRPAQDTTREEVLAYLELAIEKYGGFARANAKTPEGFEAAATVASLLSQTRHPDALKFAELATETAPAAGVDLKRVALCWAMVADGRLQKGDFDNSRAALEKIKAFDNGMYTQLAEQFKQAEQQIAAQRESAERLQPGKEPFPIREKDINGNGVSLEDLKGKVVLIDFWAPWCRPCMDEMPALVKLYKAQRDKGLEVLGISLDQDEAGLKNTIEKHGINWPVVSDHAGWENAVAKKWGIRSIPATFLLDRKGIIRHAGLRGEALAEAVAKLLAEKP